VIRFLVMCLLLYIGYRIVISMVAGKKTPDTPTKNHDAGEETHRDPVCGVYVSEGSAIIGRHDGQRHYFCSMNCLEKYREQLDHTSSP